MEKSTIRKILETLVEDIQWQVKVPTDIVVVEIEKVLSELKQYETLVSTAAKNALEAKRSEWRMLTKTDPFH